MPGTAAAELEWTVRRVIAESRDIAREYQAASLALRRTILRNRWLRGELRAEHAGLTAPPGPAQPESY
jgi:hypothetical protein